MEIRQYQKEDGIKEVVQRAIEAVEPESYSEEQQEHLEDVIPEMSIDFANKNRYTYFVAVEDKSIIGLAGLQIESGTVAGIFVDPDYAEEGIGSQLIARLEEEARKEELDEIEIPASLEAVEFYRKNGYRTISEEEQDIEGKNIVLKIMSKSL